MSDLRRLVQTEPVETLRWEAIRTVGRGQEEAFEELCCQLAAHEHPPPASRRCAPSWTIFSASLRTYFSECRHYSSSSSDNKVGPSVFGAPFCRPLERSAPVVVPAHPRSLTASSNCMSS